MMFVEKPYKDRALKAAKELYYGKSIINQIKQSDDEAEIARIMINARHNKFGY